MGTDLSNDSNFRHIFTTLMLVDRHNIKLYVHNRSEHRIISSYFTGRMNRQGNFSHHTKTQSNTLCVTAKTGQRFSYYYTQNGQASELYTHVAIHQIKCTEKCQFFVCDPEKNKTSVKNL